MEYVTMNDKTLALARSFKLATLLMLHAKVQDKVVWESARDAAEITHYARIVGRYNVLKCNQPTTKRQDSRGRNALEYAVEIAAKYGATIHVGDPRGPVRIYWRDELPADCTDPDLYTHLMHDIEV